MALVKMPAILEERRLLIEQRSYPVFTYLDTRVTVLMIICALLGYPMLQ